MSRIIKIVFIIAIVVVNVDARPKSKLLKMISNHLPSYVEFGWMCNIVNTYVQVSQFVRTTNAMVRDFKEARDQIEQTSGMVKELYGNLTNLSNVDCYDMNTWSNYLDNVSISLTWDVQEILLVFDEIDRKTVGNALRYPDQISDILSYDVRYAKNSEVIDKYYVGDKFTEIQERFDQTLIRYSENTIEMLESLRANEVQSLIVWQETRASTEDEKKRKENKLQEIQDRINQIDKEINELRQGNTSYTLRSKTDTLLELSKNLIATNMTEIQMLSERAKEYDKIIRGIQNDFDDMKSGNVNTSPLKTAQTIFDDISFKSDHVGEGADKAPVPSAPSPISNITSINKKNISNKDILHFRNQIDFVLLKQEAMLRDVEMIKANTLSFIIAFEALRKHKCFDDVVIQSHNFRFLQNELQKVKEEIIL